LGKDNGEKQGKLLYIAARGTVSARTITQRYIVTHNEVLLLDEKFIIIA
jgi:hypothetical protein